MKLEKTKISIMLHEFKVLRLEKGTEEYNFITNIVNKIDNTPAKEKERVISIYEDFLMTYIMNGMGKNKIRLMGRGMEKIILLMNSKIQHNYINNKIEEWEKLDVL